MSNLLVHFPCQESNGSSLIPEIENDLYLILIKKINVCMSIHRDREFWIKWEKFANGTFFAPIPLSYGNLIPENSFSLGHGA